MILIRRYHVTCEVIFPSQSVISSRSGSQDPQTLVESPGLLSWKSDSMFLPQPCRRLEWWEDRRVSYKWCFLRTTSTHDMTRVRIPSWSLLPFEYQSKALSLCDCAGIYKKLRALTDHISLICVCVLSALCISKKYVNILVTMKQNEEAILLI